MRKKIVIYTRFSDPKQRMESLEAQEKKCRQALSQAKIDHAHAVVMKEAAKKGDREDREVYVQILTMIEGGEIAVLCVDQQSRFSRGVNVKAMVRDIVYGGGRFITANGIDTIRPGWEDQVGLHEIHSQMEIRDTGWRVRRSQEQRVEDKNGSAGDFPFGYRSEFVDPVAALNYRGRGPKPLRKVVVDEAVAAVVRQIFARFIAGNSIGSIVRWLNDPDNSILRVGKAAWHHQHVHRILTNEKYVGRWVYGRTTTLRNSQGKKKQVAALPHQKITVVMRPDLRIIDPTTWDCAQDRIQKLLDQFGVKPGGKKRGPDAHYTTLYPRSLLGGLIYCSKCGSRMIVAGSNGVKRLGCPLHRAGTCSMAHRVRFDKAETAILEVVQSALLSYPEWIRRAKECMRQTLREMANAVPVELEAAKSRLSDVQLKIDRIVDAIENGMCDAELRDRLKVHQSEKELLIRKIAKLEGARTCDIRMPDDGWVSEELKTLGRTIGKTYVAIPVIRSMIGKVQASEVLFPGKKRGYVRLRFRLDGWAAISQIISAQLGTPISVSLNSSQESTASDEFIVELGVPTKMDQWAPQIAEWRNQNVPWKEIVVRTGLKLANACLAYKRYLNGGGKAT